MDVYEFDKCLLDRLQESLSVLSWKDEIIPASAVSSEWSTFIELQIEPVGWQALWKLPRLICEELKLRFPTVVFGYVEQVLFKELKAVFLIQAVQDEDVHLPERHEVSLEDLWPTRAQENTELNVERTADCLDRLRFFYTHVWMPWDGDNDDDLNWVEKHLESRIRFCYDLRKRSSMKRTLAAHIRTLLTEARYMQQRREYLELDMNSDDDEGDATAGVNSAGDSGGIDAIESLDETTTLDKSQLSGLMRLHLRLAMIRSEIELLENPEMRRIYEEINFDDEKHLKDARNASRSDKQDSAATLTCASLSEATVARVCYIISLPCSIGQQIELLRLAEARLPSKNSVVQMCPSLQDVLGVCEASDHILLSPGRHTIKFLEYLNDNGSISGLIKEKLVSTSKEKSQTLNVATQSDDADNNNNDDDVILISPDDDSILLVFDGDFTLEHLVLDCQNVRSGILVKNGRVRLRNCRLIGDGKSSTQQGIVCSGAAELTLENCIIERFATAVILNEGSSLAISKTKISDCQIGLDQSAKMTKVHFERTRICGARKCGIYVDSVPLPDTDAKYLTFQQLNELTEFSWSGDCAFKNCRANICVINQLKTLTSDKTLRCIFEDNEIVDSQEPPYKIQSIASI